MTADTPDLGMVFLLGVLSLLLLLISWKRGFFAFEKTAGSSELRWFHPVTGFAIYFIASTYSIVFFQKMLRHVFATPLPLLSWLNFLNAGSIFCLLFLYVRLLSATIRKEMWCSDKFEYRKDFQVAALSYVLSFPLVLFINHLLDLLVSTLFHVHEVPDQLAVAFLKMTFQHPFYLFLALCSVILFAPLIEELLFRGLLQSFIRRHLGSKQAIVITSLLFSFFHYSHEQGLANITIIGSLFTLSLFIGFTYEKRRSLAAPITFHALFNTVSVVNLYFLGGLPKGSL